MDNPFKSPAVISFCPGILGIERGLKRAGVQPRVMAYVEIEAIIIANLVAGMEAGILDPAPIWTDAKTFDARPFRGRIHGIIGGYPCTPFSLAGTRSGEDHPGHIYPAISRAIEATRPIWCLFENVDDHLSLGFDSVYKDLQRMGYAVEAGIYTAEEVGAPHERERLFILAVANGDGYYYGNGPGNSNGKSQKVEGAKQRQERNEVLRQWMRDVIRNSGEELANSKRAERRKILTGNQGNQQYNVQREGTENSTGFEQCGQELVNSKGITEREQADEANAQPIEEQARAEPGERCEQWPARPGELQHAWEAPRTIEPGLGVSIDGYSFREDLLRALGNSVVEQTAELAFIDLMNKHLKNLK